MSLIWDTPFIVVDIETTGSNAEKNRMIDIACIKVHQGEVVTLYESLVNPHQFIPPFIINMTGISNEMAFTAPEEDGIIREVNSLFIMPEAIFVAHNVNFDFSFVRNSVERNGLGEFLVPKLCTLKLAKRLLPFLRKRNVGALAQHFSITIKNRHRAFGDAYATAHILLELIEIAEKEHGITTIDELLKFQNKPVKHFKPPSASFNAIEDKIEKLPNEPGVYYYLDRKGTILYIGKAKSLKDRVRSYFNASGVSSKKISEMLKRVRGLKWDQTGTELNALLTESRLIKKHKPKFNTADKKYREFPFIKLDASQKFPYPVLVDEIENDGSEYFGPFRSVYLVNEIIETIDKQFKLRKCEGELKVDPENDPCFYYQIERCGAPCAEIVGEKEYSEEIERVRKFLSGYSDGIINRLERKMHIMAEDLNFEEAAMILNQITELRRLFERNNNVPTSINKNNVILLFTANFREKTIEVLFIKKGKLERQEIIGRKAPLDNLGNAIDNIYFKNNDVKVKLTKKDVDELRIITSWVFRKNGMAKFVYIEGCTKREIKKNLENIIRNFEFEKEEKTDSKKH
jgi:DNA polymerase III subunit epsilon